MPDLMTLAWPASRLGEALEALARMAGLAPRAVEPLSPPAGLFWHGDEAFGRWLAAAADHHRGRTASYPTAPAQIPACSFPAPGSSGILASAIRPRP
jgi:hypothetical protein